MLKSFMDFMATGALVITGYLLYFVSVTIITIILGIPVAIGIKIIIEFINIIFNGV